MRVSKIIYNVTIKVYGNIIKCYDRPRLIIFVLSSDDSFIF